MFCQHSDWPCLVIAADVICEHPLVKLSKYIVLVNRIELPKCLRHVYCEHSPVSGCVAQCGLGTKWIASSTHGAHCRYSSSWLPNYKIIISSHSIQHTAYNMTNTTFPRHVFLPPPCKLSCKYDSQIFYVNQRTLQHEAAGSQPRTKLPSASYTLTAGAVWRLQWVHQQPSRCGHGTRYLDTYLEVLEKVPSEGS